MIKAISDEYSIYLKQALGCNDFRSCGLPVQCMRDTKTYPAPFLSLVTTALKVKIEVGKFDVKYLLTCIALLLQNVIDFGKAKA